ncbi:MAG TPA: hypothetical protein PLP66_09070 [Phycisphaerae bacterium]|nr:hypothetical protein [Phycisphaerae bacterium]HQL53839.1 hypothetical protein [Phycisphaerae bacterium]
MTGVAWGRMVRAGLVMVLAAVLGGCPTDGTTDGDSNDTQDGNTPGGSVAKCSVDSDYTPVGVPIDALAEAEDKIARYGNKLNDFWKLSTCVFRADASAYTLVRQNAISYSLPPSVVYDPGLFERFVQEWDSELPTMLIVAHEWGHQVQYANNIRYSTSFEYEQDADVRGGYYMGTLAQQDGSANVSEIAELLKEFACTTGDPDSVPWFAEGAHGTCEQRANAVINGFNQAISTATVGRGAVSSPGAPAPMAGGWAGEMTMRVTVIESGEIAVTKSVPYDYTVTIDDNGKVTDDAGNGPLPDVGEQRIIPVETSRLDLDIVSTTTAATFDDTATRYDMELSVEDGQVGAAPVTGTGIESAVYALLEDGRLNAYLYDSLALTTDTGVTVTIVIEVTGALSRVD